MPPRAEDSNDKALNELMSCIDNNICVLLTSKLSSVAMIVGG